MLMITGYSLAQHTSDITSLGEGIALTIPVFSMNSFNCDRNPRGSCSPRRSSDLIPKAVNSLTAARVERLLFFREAWA